MDVDDTSTGDATGNTGDSGIGNAKHLKQSRICLPWMFGNERRRVFNEIFSTNIEEQRRGYDKLLMWKARQSNLPVGVECTLILLQVHLIDQDFQQQTSNINKSTYSEHDLQLMMSSAVMRCLNHIGNVIRTSSDTLYSVAKKLDLPHWLVLLRHNTAHASNLPSLSVLRMALKYQLQWFNDNYWNETSLETDWIVSKGEMNSDKAVDKFLDTWQALRVYYLNGFEYVNQIPEENIRHYLVTLITGRSERKRRKRRTEYVISGEETLLDIMKILECGIIKSIKRLSKIGNIEKALSLLLKGEALIPPISLITGKRDNEVLNDTILQWMGSFWGNLFVLLQENFALYPSIIHKLLVLLSEEKNDKRKLIMSLWIRQLCHSMIKSEAIMKEIQTTHLNMSCDEKAGFKFNNNSLDKQLNVPQIKLKEIFYTKLPNVNGSFCAFTEDVDANFCHISDVKYAVLNMTKYSGLFLHSLMMVSKPQIPEKSRTLLEKLIFIYSDSKLDIGYGVPKEIYTVDNLKKETLTFTHEANEGDEADDLSFWNLASDYAWATCPLGVLPWQTRESLVLDLPSNITWQSQSNDDSVKICNYKHHNKVEDIVLQKVDWINLTKRQGSLNTAFRKRNMSLLKKQIISKRNKQTLKRRLMKEQKKKKASENKLALKSK